jgi:hypothetical protein
MDLANKTFRNNRTGETIKVIDSFEDIAILENKQKINVKQLMDPSQYTEQIDPDSFFNSQGAYNSLADKIKNIPTNNIVDGDGQVTVNFGDDSFRPAMNESAVIMSNEDDERAALMAKYGAVGDGNEAAKQAETFNKILNPEAETPVETYTPKTEVSVNNTQQVEVNREYQPPVQRVEVDDPVVTMFKRTKRNVKFDVSFEISDKIPRLDFIEMMEDSYEISIIDFLADEFTNKILQDPTSIRENIKDKIKQLVYGGTVTKKTVSNTVQSEENETKEEDKDMESVSSKKLSASDRVKMIMSLETVEEVEETLKGEKAKSVKEAGEKRIKQLKK